MGGGVNKEERARQAQEFVRRIFGFVEDEQTPERRFLRRIGEALSSKGKCSDDKQHKDDNHRGPNGKGGGNAACVSLQENNENNTIMVR